VIANLSDAERALFYQGEHGEGKLETLLTQAEYFLPIPPSCLKFFAPLLSFWGFSGSAGCCVAGSLGGQTKFAEILLGERGLGIADGFEVLGFDFLVNFASVDRDGFGSIDTDAHIVAIDTLYDQDDVVTDLDRFVDFSGKCKHRSGLSLDAYAVSSMRTWVVE
jgi:hypothetical protein